MSATFEGDFSGIHFGREGAIDNLARGEGPADFNSLFKLEVHQSGPERGFSGLWYCDSRRDARKLPRIDKLLLEQDIANRGTTAWEIVYGSLVDCIPPAEESRRLSRRKLALEQVGEHLAKAIRLRREGRKDEQVMLDLGSAMQRCDSRLLDVVSLRSETIESKRRMTPLFQHARDNCNGLAVWLDTRVLEMLDHLTSEFRREEVTRHQVAKLYRTTESLLRAEAARLEQADRRTASSRRHRMVPYMHARQLHFNPDCGLLGLAELPRQLEEFAELVERVPDPRRVLSEFTTTWTNPASVGCERYRCLERVANLRSSGHAARRKGS